MTDRAVSRSAVDDLLKTAAAQRDHLKFPEAEASIKQAYTLDQHAPRVWYQLGILRMHQKDYAGASSLFGMVHEALPNSPEPCYLAGLCANNLGLYDDSLVWLKRATKRHDRFEGGDAWAAYGNSLYLHGRSAEGWDAHSKALKCRAEDAVSRFMQSWIYLLRGDYLRGFELYESRWEVGNHIRSQHGHRTPLDNLPPRWDGKAEGRVLIYSEQGSGDTIQMSRYFSLVWRYSKQMPYVMCQPELVPLFAGWDARPSKAEIPEADYSIPVFSLPRLFGVIPADLDSTLAAKELEPEGFDTSGFRVGLCWSGSTEHANDSDRSMPVEYAERLLAQISGLGAEVVNLNHGRGLSTLPPVYFTDYGATARLIGSLNAVVSVDTSVAHLAGTLAVPTLCLLQTAPEWRWGLNSASTAWYESMTLVRRKDYKDWPGAIAQVVEYLKGMVK